MKRRWTKLISPLCLPLLLWAAAGCSDETESSPADQQDASDDGSTAQDGSPEASPSEGGTDGQAQDAGDGATPEALSVERWGDRIWGPILSLRRTGRTLWVGTAGVPDPYATDPNNPEFKAGLVRLNIDSGEVRVFDKELPSFAYTDIGGQPAGMGPVSTAAVIEDGARYLVVARSGLVVYENNLFTLQTLTVPGDRVQTPTGLVVDRNDGRKRLWISGDQGLLRLNADTFEIEKLYGSGDLGFTQTGALTLDPATGAVYVAVYDDTGLGSRLARVEEDAVTTLEPGEQDTPGGFIGDVLWDTLHHRALAAVGAWSAGQGGVLYWDGQTAGSLVKDPQLSLAAHGEVGPFGAQKLAYDEQDHLLIVGGNIAKVSGGLRGGGLAWVNLDEGKIAGLSSGDSLLPGDHVTALEYDPVTRRTYASLRTPCNDIKLGNLGLLALSFRSDGSLRLERPILSGVRSLAVVGEELYAGLRDENPGLSCDGYAVQTGLVKVKANHSGELVALKSVGSTDEILPFAGPTALSVLNPQRFVIGTYRDGTFIGDPSTGGFVFNQTLYGPSLYTTDIKWADATSFWETGPTSHDSGDPDSVADRGPRGAALFKLNDRGQVQSAQHYVRLATEPEEIGGLPSGQVYQVLIAPDGTVYLVCGIERLHTVYDRLEGEPFELHGEQRKGGVAKVAPDGTVSILATSEHLPDPRAAAFDAQGNLLVLDAQKGLLKVSSSGVEPVTTPQPPQKSIPQAFWTSQAAGNWAALYSTGVQVQLGGASQFIDQVGYAWRATERVPGVLLVGTDRGLVRVRPQSVGDKAEGATETGALPPFASTEQPDAGPDAEGPEAGEAGACATEGQTCHVPQDCCPGLNCGGSGFALECVQP